MNIHKVREIAAAEFLKHKIDGTWSFSFDKGRKRFGMCDYRTRTISLSLEMTVFNFEDEVVDTIRHEIAHALAGYKAGHGPAWGAMCNVVGCRPLACYSAATVARRGRKVSEFIAARMENEE